MIKNPVLFIKPLFILAGLLTIVLSHAQNIKMYKRDSAYMSDCKNTLVYLAVHQKDSNIVPLHLPFNNFVVNDVRFFSGYVGGRIKKDPISNNISYERFDLAKKMSAAVTEYLNNSPAVSFTAPGIILSCFVKKLLITQLDSTKRDANRGNVFNKMSFEIEGYLVKDGRFYPAVRMDTVALLATKRRNKYEVLNNVLDAFIARAAAIDTAKVFKRSAYPGSDLEQRYKARFDKPILQAQQLNKGVYASFVEFINNNPSGKEFEFKKDRGAGILYTRTGNDWIPCTKAFGFCDGKVIWINVARSFYPLVKQGNTFAFMADYYNIDNRIKSSTSIHFDSNPLVMLGGSLAQTALDGAVYNSIGGKVFYQLDMETGEFD